MTPEQASKLRKGARILVEMVVGPPPPNLGAWAETVVLAGVAGEMARPIPMSAIHSILPRPLEAGDRVRDVKDDFEGTIIAVANDEAWVCWLGSDTTVEPLSDLQRVEDEDRKAKEG